MVDLHPRGALAAAVDQKTYLLIPSERSDAVCDYRRYTVEAAPRPLGGESTLPSNLIRHAHT
jgi:hypothetical protein